ncbi:hypothetical protein DEQ92_20795 [Haloferax sp. Atlit-6N]|uniref:hypothetical protein n=1 Tax=Haloferacaceae TaxID=1644056 RepID=UPI000E27918B|nr:MULTISPECIES: hypothetical protein [Haloferacaceae]RDZ99787.1 hypothetical protein DEQ92_20795 [Haloferax sp. Atlit-6N]RLM83702.1 hypothetical protein D3D02_17010 [Halobellus sp. Atlit-38R]
MNTQKQRTNGQATGPPQDGPRDELDVAHEIITPTTYEQVLREVGLGSGVYDSDDISMQMRSFRKGMIVDTAFDELLFKRAVYETKVRLADNGYTHYNETTDNVQHWDPVDDEMLEEMGRTQAIRKRGKEIWESLSQPGEPISEKQAAAMAEYIGVDGIKPVFWRLMAAYHEASKGREGRTQDNYFQRVKKSLVNEISSDGSGGRFSFGGGN